jgi:hypothetical protein
MSLLRTAYSIENKQPFKMARVQEVKALIEAGVDPLTVTISTSGGGIRLGVNDVANYMEYYAVPFDRTVQSFELVGEQNERTALIKEAGKHYT